MIQIPQPCSKKWNNLAGDDQQRFCSSCQKYVSNWDKVNEIGLVHLPKGTYVKISKNKLESLNVLHTSIWLKYKVIAVVLLSISTLGQSKGYRIKGRYVDQNNIPMTESKIRVKNSDQEVYTDEDGGFEIILPQMISPFTLIYSTHTQEEKELVLDENKLDQPIEIKLENSDEDEILIDEVIYKPTFKQRVINTITWPYRKIRTTFFGN